MRRTDLLAALAIFLLPALVGAGEGSPPMARLRVRANYSGYAGHGFARMDEEIFLTTARLVTATRTGNYLQIVNPGYWLASTQSKVARKNIYARLERDLLANGIESQEGDCSVAVPVTPTDGYYEIAWFDGTLRKDLRVELTYSASTCPPEIANIINSINTFARSVGISNFGVHVE
ncbi:MAG: hypothetical protein ACJ76J_29540 [Thermoanaerobaculia bacterium]